MRTGGETSALWGGEKGKIPLPLDPINKRPGKRPPYTLSSRSEAEGPAVPPQVATKLNPKGPQSRARPIQLRRLLGKAEPEYVFPPAALIER
jgi:hypothetical protein